VRSCECQDGAHRRWFDAAGEVPRDRDGSFEPKIVKKGERRFTGFDEKIIAMYARRMSVREIRGYLQELYEITFLRT